MACVSDPRIELLEQLEGYYRHCGWSVRAAADGILCAAGPGDVTWHGTAIVSEDLHDPEQLDSRLLELAARRMAGGGELCPLDLLPAPGCEPALREALDRTGLSARPHVSVYGLTAAA